MDSTSIRRLFVRMSPVRFVTLLAVCVFVMEVGVMSVLSVIVPSFGGGLLVAIVDASILIAFLTPVLWWVVVRPLQDDVVGEQERVASLVAILEATPDLVGVADPQGHLVYLNRAGRKMISLDEGEDPSRYNIGAFYDAANIQVVLTEAIPTAMRDGSWSGETELTALDGRKIAVSQVILSHKKADGAMAGTSTIARDITEPMRSEQALRASEEKYRGLFESSPDAIVTLGPPSWRITAGNAAAVAMFGTKNEKDLLTLGPVDVSPERQPDGRASAEKAAELIETVLREGFLSCEWTLQRIGGAEFPATVSVSRIQADGAEWIQATVRDITERKRAEESHALLAKAVEQAAEAVMIVDAGARIVYVNPAFEKVTQYTREEAIGQNPRILKSGKHDAEFYRSMWAVLTAGQVWNGHLTNKRKDGTLYDEDSTISPVRDAAGAIVNYVAVKRDVTEQAILEGQLRQSQRMEAVGQLASGIAHDFNNLLGVINGLSDLVLSQLPPGDQTHSDVEEIHAAGERAAVLTRQLLAFSRQQIVEPRVVNVSTVVAGMESLLRRVLGEDVNLVVVPGVDMDSVKADVGQLEQVLTNLAVNARDAMPQGGTLTIGTQNVTVEKRYARRHGADVPVGSYVRLAVTDSGVGMDEATRARIFEPFFTTKAQGQGTGLGLSTVYGIVKQSQGFIWVYSEVGQGTCFKVYLPRVSEAPAPARDGPAPTVASRACTETILILEDNEGLRRLATRLLEKAGYTVLAAGGGREALRLLEREDVPVHLLLSDVVMPDMGGPQAAKLLGQMRPGMKVLYMSGYTSDTVVRQGVLESQVHFVGKPFTEAELLRKVGEALDGHQ